MEEGLEKAVVTGAVVAESAGKIKDTVSKLTQKQAPKSAEKVITWVQPIKYEKKIHQKPHNLVAKNRVFDVEYQKKAKIQEEQDQKKQLAEIDAQMKARSLKQK